MGRDKKITCRKCFRVMRKDNLKIHEQRIQKGEKSACHTKCGNIFDQKFWLSRLLPVPARPEVEREVSLGVIECGGVCCGM